MPDSIQGNSKRIAKNTLMLYVRMFLIMAITLYTSRVILRILGVEDYGIYNVVGGVVALFNIVTGALSITISRYITFELGKGDKDRLCTVFSTSVMMQLAMAIALWIIAEIGGVWFLNHKINLPPDRLYAAHWVLQFSILTFMVNLVSVPYNATIIAHERMSAFAYISILEVSLRLLIVFLLALINFDKLITYAFLFLCVAIVVRFTYSFYCQRHFEESRFHFVFDKKLICDMFSLLGWAFWGNGAVVLRDQGSNILLNIFFGPAVNAARAVAVQVNMALYNFTTNFLTAINPQITKSYSSGDIEYMHTLLIRGTKYAFFILLMLFMPLCANLDYVLSLWLVEVPAHTSAFIFLTLMYSLFDCFCNPLVTGVLAQGQIRNYEIILVILYVFNVAVSYFFLKWGYAPEWVFVLNIIFKVFVICALLWHSHMKYAFPIGRFLRQTVSRCAIVFCLCYAFISLPALYVGTPFISFLTSCACVFCFESATIYFIGLTRKETSYFMSAIKNKIRKRL